MSVEFETDQLRFQSKTAFGRTGATGMSGWLVKKGIIKDESQAKGIFTAIIFINLILTGLIIYFFVL